MESYQAKVRQIGRIEPDSFTKIRVCTKCETEIKKDFKYDWGWFYDLLLILYKKIATLKELANYGWSTQ